MSALCYMDGGVTPPNTPVDESTNWANYYEEPVEEPDGYDMEVMQKSHQYRLPLDKKTHRNAVACIRADNQRPAIRRAKWHDYSCYDDPLSGDNQHPPNRSVHFWHTDTNVDFWRDHRLTGTYEPYTVSEIVDSIMLSSVGDLMPSPLQKLITAYSVHPHLDAKCR
jgi:hypothetical protein